MGRFRPEFGLRFMLQRIYFVDYFLFIDYFLIILTSFNRRRRVTSGKLADGRIAGLRRHNRPSGLAWHAPC